MADSMADTLDDLEVQAIDSSSDESTSATDIITDVSTTVTVAESRQIAEFSSCSTSSGVVDLLNTLKVPRASSLSRKRLLSRRNPRKSLARGAADPVTITPAQRAREFSNESFKVSLGKLFCTGCREEIGLKRSVIQNHVKSLKHKRGQERLRVKEARERDLADALKRHDQQISQAGDTLPEAQRIFRVKVAMTFLRAGVPFEKVFYFRELLEESAYRLVDKRHLLDIIPFILKEEKAQIKKEIEDKFVSVIFDGTSRLGEVLVVLLRYVHQMKIEQRLVRVELLAKSLKGEEVARELISILSVTLGIKTGLLIAAMRDRASVNNVAVRTLSIVYPSLLDVGCIAHTLDHVGEKFQTTVLNNFVTQWISLFSHSPKYRLLWKTQTGISMKSYSKTRWWSRWEVMEQMLTHFNDIPLFLGNEEVTSVTANKLSEVLVDTSKRGLLKLELAAVIDLGSHFVKATYNLEGDGPLVLKCYEIIEEVKAAIQAAHYPNVTAVAEMLAGNNAALVSQYSAYAIACLKPGLQYFHEALDGPLQTSMKAFRAARLLSPSKMHEMNPMANEVDSLRAFPFLNEDSVINGLKEELPTYMSKAADVDPDYDPVQWWREHGEGLPRWSNVLEKALLVQPSSAGAERVFSLLSNTFGDHQYNCLEDYIETSLMLQYNKRS